MRFTLGKTKSIKIDFLTVFERVARDCDLDEQTIRYCLKRLYVEGITFWTKTLPKLAKSVLYSIECGIFNHNVDSSNKLTDFAWKGRSLRYFRGLLSRIFCQTTGVLLPNPDASALQSIRQICEYVYKLALDFDDRTITRSEENYEQIQKEVGLFKTNRLFEEQVRKDAETYFPELFRASIDEILRAGPRFGPGAFGLFGDLARKSVALDSPFYEWKQLGDNLSGTCDKALAPYSGYFKPYPSSPTRINVIEESRIASVLFVPKDSRGPRVISKEPLHVIKPQMAFLTWATGLIERITHNRVNFRDQSINQALAREGSISGNLATLDLKEASDRIARSKTGRLFRNAPGISYLLKLCRSTSYKLPSGKTGTMNALAGMGSGLTFPMLALSIHLVICTYVSRTLRLPYKQVSAKVYVYGDDLVIPKDWYDLACTALSLYGLKVNQSKSYVKGPFRESCGGDFLLGKEVSPIRLKLQNCGLPQKLLGGLVLRAVDCISRKSKSREYLGENLVLQLAKHCIELRKMCMFGTAAYYESILKTVIPMPYVGEGSPVLGIYTEDTNLIVSQAKKSTDGGSTRLVSGVTVSPRRFASGRVCPYKFMAGFLKKSSVLNPCSMELGNSIMGTAFGEIPIPRSVKLKQKEHSVTVLLPVSKEKTVVFLGTL
jgi:hypothetical protein